MVEGARLESVCRGNSTEGSNPSLSAIRSFDRLRIAPSVAEGRLAWLPFPGAARLAHGRPAMENALSERRESKGPSLTSGLPSFSVELRLGKPATGEGCLAHISSFRAESLSNLSTCRG